MLDGETGAVSDDWLREYDGDSVSDAAEDSVGSVGSSSEKMDRSSPFH